MANAAKRDNAKLWPMGPATFPNLWILFCAFFSFFTAISAIPLVIIVIKVWHNDVVAHQSIRPEDYLGNSLGVYGGTLANGYVANSTIPKQNGGIVFVSMFLLAILILTLLVILTDLAWYSEMAQGFLEAFHIAGMKGPDRDQSGQVVQRPQETQFVFTVFFFKFFTAVCLATQSFATFSDGNGREPVWSDTDTWNWRWLASWYVVLYVPNAILAGVARQQLFGRMMENGSQKNLMITHARWRQVKEHKDKMRRERNKASRAQTGKSG